MYIHPGYPDLYEETLSKITAEFSVVSEKEIQSLVSKYSTSTTSGEGKNYYVMVGELTNMGMLTLGLSSYLLKIPNDAYTTLNSDWLFDTQSRVLQADWFILEIVEMATLNINMPYLFSHNIINLNKRSKVTSCHSSQYFTVLK